MSLGSIGVDWVGSLRKILTRLRVTNFCTSLTRFRLSVVTQSNGPKCTQIVRNAQKHEFRVQWWRIGCVCCEKFRRDFVGTNFFTSLTSFAPSFVRRPNSPKCTQKVENRPKHEFRVQWGGSGAFVAKNSDGTSWQEVFHQFDPFYTKCCYATKQSQMHPNNTKHTKT